jgi:hypothetical protein
MAARDDGVALRRELVEELGPSAVKWRVARRTWQSPVPGVVVLHNGPLSPRQERRVDVLSAGAGAVLAGLTALEEAGSRATQTGKGVDGCWSRTD